MARIKVVMPQMGESITTGTITKWHKVPGDAVEIDETLLDISTDKVESEIPSPVNGRMEKLYHQEGDTVDVGVMIAEIEDEPANVPFAGGAGKDQAKQGAAAAAPVAPVAPATTTKTATTAAPTAATSPTPTTKSDSDQKKFFTPLVRTMAREHNIDLSELEHLEGHGAAGRVNRQDFEDYLAKRQNSKVAPAVATATAAPAAKPSTTAAAKASGRVEVVPMDNMRKAIARNMVASKLTSPHVNSVSEVDMSHLVLFRESFKDEFQKQEGFKLTYTPFIVYALIQALKEFPLVNSSVDGDNILVKKDINLALAVAVPGNGLIVPVIQGADNLNMLGICRAIQDLATKARNRKLTMENLAGGTFTFTNVGSFGTLLATPVILQPQVGIYASGVIQKRPVVIESPTGDALAIRHMMYGTHTYDHRIVDGELGGKFLEATHRYLRELSPRALF